MNKKLSWQFLVPLGLGLIIMSIIMVKLFSFGLNETAALIFAPCVAGAGLIILIIGWIEAINTQLD